jgi:endo-1,4-beta-xylanase
VVSSDDLLMTLSRREFLGRAAAFGSLAASTHYGLAHAARLDGVVDATDAFEAPLMTLKDAAARSGLLVGCAVNAQQLSGNLAYQTLVHQQANILVAENAFKFGPLHPEPKSYNFQQADAIAEFARMYGMRLRGHNFVWHEALPAWFESYVTPENAQRVMEEHIATVGGHFAGKVHSWDVVNEAIHLEDGKPDGMRDSPWLRLMGPGYVETAFRAARKADPKAQLFYNEYGIEGEDEGSVSKRGAVLALLRSLLERGVPVDGLGIQSHLTAGHAYGAGVRSLIQQARAMGLRVMVTELDVNDKEIAGPASARDAAVAETYNKYLRAVLADGYVSGVLTWGITDKLTWLNAKHPRADGEDERPLPFDAEMKPKAAFVAQRRALAQAPRVIPVLRPRTEVLLASGARVVTGK